MKPMIKLFVVMLLIATPIISISQEDVAFKQFLSQNLEKDLSNLDNGNNLTPFLSAFSSDLDWVWINIGIDGTVTKKNFTKDQLRKSFSNLGPFSFLKINWKIQGYNELTNKVNTRVATFEVNVTITKGDDVISKGVNSVEIVAKKVGDTYLITYISVLNITNESYKGKCYIQIKPSETNKSNFTTFFYYPNGLNYMTVNQEVSFTESNKLQKVQFNPSGKIYYWNPATGTITLEKDGSVKIGSANDKNSVIMYIIKNQNNKKCNTLIKTSKER